MPDPQQSSHPTARADWRHPTLPADVSLTPSLEAGDEVACVLKHAPAAIAITRGAEHRFAMVNEMYVRIFGRRDYIGRAVHDVFPEVEAQGFTALMDRVYRTGEPYSATGARLLWQSTADGVQHERFFTFVYQPLYRAGAVDGILTFALDVTEHVSARREAEAAAQLLHDQALELEQSLDASQALTIEMEETARQAQTAALAAQEARDEIQRSEERYRALVEASSLLVWTANPIGEFTTEQAGWAAFSGQTMEEYRGFGWLRAIHPEDRDDVVARWNAAVRAGAAVVLRARVRRHDGVYRHHAIRVVPVRHTNGTVREWVGAHSDIDERVRTERATRLLSDVSQALAYSLEYPVTLERIAQLVVPALADWCLVDVLGDDQEIHRVAIAYADPAKGDLARRYRRPFPYRPEKSYGVSTVIATGRPQLVTHVTDDILREIATDAEHLGMLRSIGATSFAIVPLVARGRALGVMSFVATGSRERYTERDLPLLEEVARRAAVAADNAQLFTAEQAARERATTLQAITAALASAVTTEAVAQVVVAHAVDALGAAAGTFALLTADGSALELAGASGYPPHIMREWHRFPLTAPAALAEAVRTRRPLFLESVAERERYPHLAYAPTMAGFGAWAALPLLVDDHPLGAIVFAFATPHRFDAGQRTFLMSVAAQAALAVHRAHAFAAERRARAAAEGASYAKTQFLANMSHELRTPLNAIIGYEQLLSEGISGPVTEAQRRQLGRINASARHLLTLIDEVLTLSRVEAGREMVQLEPVAAADAIDAAAAMVEPLATEKGLALVVRRPPPTLVIETDPQKLRQALLNLLGNAIKFTHTGSVTLGAHAEAGELVIEVADTGIGITAEHRERIFEPFWQVEAARTRTAGGTGLGLAVTRRLARLLGGDVTVESEHGVGSTFRLRLPLTAPRSPLRSPEPRASSPPNR